MKTKEAEEVFSWTVKYAPSMALRSSALTGGERWLEHAARAGS